MAHREHEWHTVLGAQTIGDRDVEVVLVHPLPAPHGGHARGRVVEDASGIRVLESTVDILSAAFGDEHSLTQLNRERLEEVGGAG